MRIIRTVPEFKQALTNPDSNEIYGLIPDSYEIVKQGVEEILGGESDCLVYGDVEITNGQDSIIKFNPSFDIGVINRQFHLTSPIYLKTSRPITLKSDEFNQLVIELLHHVVGIHIPETIFRWKQNFYIGPAKNTNII
jgi:hypothetical protein